MLINTQSFREAALYFQKHKKYDCGVKGTREYEKYWLRERDRCLYGYSSGGVWIPGHYYYYLNYNPIAIVEKIKGSKSGNRIIDHVHFWDVDYMFFMSCHIAKYGIGFLDPKGEGDYNRALIAYRNLPINLGLVETKSNLSGGKHLLWLKPRGVGASFKGSTMVNRNYHLLPQSKSYLFADSSEYLTKDGIFNKFLMHNKFVNTNTAFKQTSEVKASVTNMHFKSSYKDSNGSENGFLSEVIGVTFGGDYNKARGKRGELIIYEEFGKFPYVEDAWNVARNSVEEGDVVYGLMIGFGTGGSEGNDFQSMETMSQNPEGYNILAFDNIWDEGLKGTSFCLFTPAYKNIQYKDKDGNSDEKKGRKVYEEQREQAKKSPDPTLLEKRKAESPFCPQEAMLNTVSNIFNVSGMSTWRNKLEASPELRETGIAKILYRDSDGFIKARLNLQKDKNEGEYPPIMIYPHKSSEYNYGSVVEYTNPFTIYNVDKDKNEIPPNLYIIGHDPYAVDDAGDTTSLGAAYVYECINNVTPSKGDRIVASWIGRPTTTDEYNHILFMLAERWNAKIGFESDRGDVVGYAKRFNKIKWLAPEFDLGFDDSIKHEKSRIGKFGMRIGSGKTNTRLLQGNKYIADWLASPRSNFESGKIFYNFHSLYDIALLKEFQLYDGKKNVDRVSAFRILMYFAKEVVYSKNTPDRNKLKKEKSSISKFFNS